MPPRASDVDSYRGVQYYSAGLEVNCSQSSDRADDIATHEVNLDAIIPRADFLEKGEKTEGGDTSDVIRFAELTGHSLKHLRKPDFQRDTNNWSPEYVVGLVESFLDRKL